MLAVACAGVELRVLGPLEVRCDGAPVPLPGGKPLVLLARLLVDAGRVVSVDALADALWHGALPTNVAGTVQVYVSNLRRLLGASTIATRSPGYAVALDGVDLDAGRLEASVASAREHRAAGRLEEALEQTRSALALVRGEPFADVAFEEWAQAEVLRLRALELAAHEELHGALLDLDRHREALPGLEGLVAAHPFHERLRAQLMTALYRDGRQVEALRCYTDGRRLLVEELGVEPGPALQQAEARILAQDGALLAAARTREASTSPAGVDPRPGPSLVGRHGARAQLRAAWGASAEGRPHVVVLEGEAGIGKTALARWVTEVAVAAGGMVGTGRAHDLTGSPPYWVWASALRDLGPAGVEELRAAAASVPGAGVLGTLLPELGPPPSEAGAQFHLFDALARTLAAVTVRAPVVLVLDDLQWADEASLDLLRFLVRTPLRARLLVVTAHRSVPPTHPLSAARADIAGEARVVRIPLQPLEPAEVVALAEQVAGRPVDDATGAAIAAKTGGNAFFVEELVRLLRTPDGAVDLERAAVPETVRGVVRQRAAHLGERAIEVLTLVSFASDHFTGALPRHLLGLDRDVVTAVLEEAVRDGLVVEVPGRPGFHRFAHDMVRHAFYDDVPQQRRAETHLALGSALVELLGADADAAAAQLADHFGHAMDVGGARAAVLWSRRAGAQAVRSSAYADALRHLRRGLFIARARLQDERVECELLIEVAAAARLAADPPTAQTARERAHRLARRLGDPVLEARAANVLLGPGPHWLRPAR